MGGQNALSAMPELIITADDCGLTEAINQTTLELHHRSYITAASVMPNFPAHHHALDIFSACPALDLGAHLTLTDGWPVSSGGPHHSHLLKDDRSFRNKFNLYLRSFFFSADAVSWIRQELDAQLRRFSERDIALQHISSHHHFHSLPRLRRIVHDLAVEHGAAWVRGHDFRASLSPHNLFHRAQRQGKQRLFTMPDHVTAIQTWMSRPVEDFVRRVAELEGLVEIVVHPGPARDPGFPAAMDYGPAPRYAETQFLILALDRLRALGVTA